MRIISDPLAEEEAGRLSCGRQNKGDSRVAFFTHQSQNDYVILTAREAFWFG
jgi:hypothetical protein